MGFANPILGGGGSLVYPSIHSPDYVHDSAGWTINKDGSAEFNNLTIRGTFAGTDYIINNSGLFFYSSTPASGNLVMSIASSAGSDSFGNSYPKGFNVQSGILPAITGVRIEVFGTTGGFLVYSGTPALGNLVASIFASAGTDPFGNSVKAGIVTYSSGSEYATLAGGSLDFYDPTNDAFAPGSIGLSTVLDTNDSLTLQSPVQTSAFAQAILKLQYSNTLGVANFQDTEILASSSAAYKAATTSRNTTTTLTADPDLTLEVSANAVYVVEMTLMNCSGAASPGLKFAFAIPTGSSGDYVYVSENSSSTLVTADPGAWTTAQSVNANNGLTLHGTLITGPDAGLSFTFQWAQNTSSATNTKVGLGSYLKLTRIA
jgi:hypothetical protein